ncbi:glycoside hydrolase family 3 N-terminal domain-containing protein [Paratractidigestivibacter sp.]|uniref:glycoside hydrolase family 3 N-terminal domain-containing protein n=1 Tax=Paratractidigestivibacter sp. TaxID=2847316 RepID=UPI002AC8AE99|nr:glycoside hydrolase family 3 N-terminal domain-containing protein [Paratractidigestivibacter sp.]
MKATTKHRILKAAGYTGAALALAIVAAANVGLALFGDTIDSYLGLDEVEISDEEKSAVMDDGRSLSERIEAEGLVLVRNENQTLPLPKTTNKVNVFGWASTQWVAGGSGSGQVSGQTKDLLGALQDAGIEYNSDLTGMYQGFYGERAYKGSGTLNSHSAEYCRLYEPSIYDKDCYSQELLDKARKYSDTAIVVIGRVAGESIDCPTTQYKVNARGGEVTVDVTRTYLELSAEEEALLRYVGSHYERVCVVVNSTNTMELGEVETIPGIDSVMLAGATGEAGATAVVKAIWGDVNPSGRTTDTYAYDFSTAASWANSGAMGEGAYTNSRGLYPADGTKNPNVGADENYDSARFVDYVEGIYVGYRWYETADIEGFWDTASNAHGTGYDAVVQYPFGYGLSYTTFSWEVVDKTKARTVSRDSEISLTVRVTNTGSAAGRDVVELYCTPPYTSGGIEKSSTVLVAYAKTGQLEPGESQDVTVSFTLDDVASYDYNDANGNGFSGYELERGRYTVELKRNAHEVADCEGASTTYMLPRTVECEQDLVSGNTVENRFTGDATRDGVSIDGSDSGADITWLTRADFAGTFPKKCDPDREMSDSISSINLFNEAQVEADAAEYAELVGTGVYVEGKGLGLGGGVELSRDGSLTSLGRELGLDFYDERWETVLDAISLADMEDIVLHGYIQTKAIDSVGKPATKEVDGPSQVGSFNQLKMGVGYPDGTVLAQTWNAGLAYEYGRQLGREASAIGVDGIYAPSTNIHRSPLGGRNYEYLSEDATLSGTMVSQVVGGAKSAGVYCFIKHLAMNNQDTYRDSLYEWVTEQALREIYLKPFQITVRNGATGFMSSYNRIGATWSGGNKALLTDVLRGEWSYCGTVITDYCDHQQYMNADQILRAGGDLYMDGVFGNGSFKYGFTSDELTAASGSSSETRAISYYTNLRRATKDILYTWLNARATNLLANEAALAEGGEGVEFYVKKNGVNWIRLGVAAADIVTLSVVGVGLARKWRARRTGRAAEDDEGPLI